MTDGYDISSEIALRLTSLDLSDDKSTLVQAMAWCRQATSHYLNQCWSRSLPPYGVTRPQWVNMSTQSHTDKELSVGHWEPLAKPQWPHFYMLYNLSLVWDQVDYTSMFICICDSKAEVYLHCIYNSGTNFLTCIHVSTVSANERRCNVYNTSSHWLLCSCNLRQQTENRSWWGCRSIDESGRSTIVECCTRSRYQGQDK